MNRIVEVAIMDRIVEMVIMDRVVEAAIMDGVVEVVIMDRVVKAAIIVKVEVDQVEEVAMVIIGRAFHTRLVEQNQTFEIWSNG